MSLSGVAHADCPTNVRDLPPTGIIASAVRLYMSPDERAPIPTFEARIGATGGMSAERGDGDDQADLGATAGLGGEVRALRRGMTGCVSADALDVRAGSVHATASGAIPLFFTGAGIGMTVDREITLPLTSRPEFLHAPLSRIGGQFSSSFVDFAINDAEKNQLRVLVVPFTVEWGFLQQDTPKGFLKRRTSGFETAILELQSRDHREGYLDASLFAIQMEWSEPKRLVDQLPTGDPAKDTRGFVRFAPLSIKYDGPKWGYEIDGGFLGLAGPVDCDKADCSKAWFRGSLRRGWRRDLQWWMLEGGLERDAFTGVDNLPVLENRASIGGSVETMSTRASATAFVADTFTWLEHEGGIRAGVRATLTHKLGHGFSGALDSEIVKSTAQMTELGSDARVMLSLAWQRATKR